MAEVAEVVIDGPAEITTVQEVSPVLQNLNQLPERSSFKDHNGYQLAFVAGLRNVVKKLDGQIQQAKKEDWALQDKDFDEQTFRQAADSVSEDDWKLYAEGGIGGNDDIAFGGREANVMMLRVWDEMIQVPGQENLAFYRGADLNESGTYGMDWAPAELNDALGFVKKGDSGQVRENPGLVSVPFKSVIEAYKKGELTMELEHGFSTSSATFTLQGESEKEVKKWSVPQEIPADNSAPVFI